MSEVKQIEVKIPSKISGFRIKHFDALVKLDEIESPMDATITQKIEINSAFTGIPIEQLRQADVKSQNAVYTQIIKSLDTYVPKSILPSSLTYEDKKFNLVKDFTKMPAGWFVDVSRMDFEKYPSQLVAMCYIEDGMIYAQTDDNKNILNLSTDRGKIFEKHLPLNSYIDLTTFFLSIWIEWKGQSIHKERIKKNLEKMKTDLSRLNGRIQSMK